MTIPNPAYIGIGSNLQEPLQQVCQALDALAALPSSRLLAHSRLYRTPPLGPSGQPDYVNGAALLNTELEPLALLDELQGIELQQGRRRNGERWGPRTLDLDLLLYSDHRIETPRLQLPHIQMHRRAFVLLPLLDIAGPDLSIPGRGILGELAAACDATGVYVISG